VRLRVPAGTLSHHANASVRMPLARVMTLPSRQLHHMLRERHLMTTR
jgi:hypothetical protein